MSALSQKEIEELIKGLVPKPEAGGGAHVARPRLRVYDFKRPDKFSRDQLRGMQLIYDNFSRQLTAFLSTFFRKAVHVTVSLVDQITYGEFSSGLSDPCCVVAAQWKPLASTVLMNLGPEMAIAMVDRLLGGEGKPGLSRQLTDIETTIFRKVAGSVFDLFGQVIEDLGIGKYSISVSAIETNPLFIQQAMAPNEIVLSVSIQLSFGGESGTVEFITPYVTLEPILPKISQRQWFARYQPEESSGDSDQALEAFKDVEIPLSIRLGEALLTVREVMSLEPGDTIELETVPGKEAVVYILGEPRFRARVGRVKNHLAVKIVERIGAPKEADDHDEKR
ncbi:MAG TPA: flagellar motor switch protein FliM [Firmicutes bacterium]|nr:flagellar motor switch protein FliM [Candidatus Fermentithermobacillaceae bacterium]